MSWDLLADRIKGQAETEVESSAPPSGVFSSPHTPISDDLAKLAETLCEASEELDRQRVVVNELRSRMMDVMKALKLQEIETGLGAIQLRETSKKSLTKKALEKILGKEEVDDIWAELPVNKTVSLIIPKKEIEELSP